ncbi:hypothetical protein ACQ86N_16815 [Puia sp. P3]|uniref:hypothetical protein n=1 Tax=Puia sp. P3 TaxID=3423952 RepID=UPI003D66EE43
MGLLNRIINGEPIPFAPPASPPVGNTSDRSTSNGNTSSGGENQGSGKGRGSNDRKPDPNATGAHSVIDGSGATTFKQNPKNPKGWEKTEHISLIQI